MTILLDKYHTGEFWRGPKFPIGKLGIPVEIVEDIDEVFSSILQILNTGKGERVMYPEFGSDVPALLWEPYDRFLEQQLTTELVRALTLWEPRVRVESIVIDADPNLRTLGILVLSIDIRLINNPRVTRVIHVPISSQGRLFA